jgi:hypothetical protein
MAVIACPGFCFVTMAGFYKMTAGGKRAADEAVERGGQLT